MNWTVKEFGLKHSMALNADIVCAYVAFRRRKQPKKTSSSVASASGGYNDYTSKELKDILRAKGQKVSVQS
jgi:hypothetical protein